MPAVGFFARDLINGSALLRLDNSSPFFFSRWNNARKLCNPLEQGKNNPPAEVRSPRPRFFGEAERAGLRMRAGGRKKNWRRGAPLLNRTGGFGR